jgi:hypothetical protein
MRRRYLRFKKWVLLQMIYALAAVLRCLNGLQQRPFLCGLRSNDDFKI